MNKLRSSYYFLIVAISLIVLYFISSIFFLEKATDLESRQSATSSVSSQIKEVLSNIYEMEASARGFIITGDSSIATTFEVKHQHLENNLIDLIEISSTSEDIVEDVAVLDSLVTLRAELMHRVYVAQDNQSDAEIYKGLIRGDLLMDSIRSQITQINTSLSQYKIDDDVFKQAADRRTLILLSAFGAIMVVVVFYSFLKTRKEISLNVKAQSAVNSLNTDLISMNENLQQFAYVASHDLQEPLRKIHAFGDLLEEECNEDADPDTILMYVNKIQGASTRMSILIKDLLEYSRVTRNNGELFPTNLNTELENVKNDMELVFKEKDVKLNVINLPKSLSVRRTQMRQLFQNMLSNAVKFTKDGVQPEIDVDCVKVEGDEIQFEEVNLDPEIEYYQISFKDNGIGFDNAHLSKVFTIFQRLHGKLEYKGTGIGLAISKKICLNHGGDLTARAKEGEGATFYIYLPVEQNQ